MKLEFLKKSMEYCRPILREVRTMEETAEAIIPDSCPDVTEVLFTGGMAFLRGKELTEGMLTLSAGVSAMALAQPEGRGVPEVVEVYIPMSVKVENSLLRPGQMCSVKAALRRLDGHLVNPRKVMVRATVAITVCVYSQVQEEHLGETAAPGVQLLRKTAPIRCLGTMGEKNYTVEDSVRLSPEGNASTLAACQVELNHTDSRLTGTRAILKGEAQLRVLYITGEGQLHTGTANVPFSQYIDLGDCQETDELRLDSCLTGADVELSADGGGLNVTLQLLTTAEVWTKREIEYIGDIYSLEGQVTPETERRSYDSLLDRQYFAPVGHGTVEGQARRVVYVDCLPGEMTHTRTGEQVELTLPVTAQVLLERDDGSLRGAAARLNLTAATRAAENCRFEAMPEAISATGSVGVDSVDVKVTGTVSVSTFSPMEFLEITGGELEEMEPQRGGPGLIIRRPRREESLWDIAKAYRTTPEAIASANGLEGDTVPDSMLLIPRSR